MNSLTIKLEDRQMAWLSREAGRLRRSKGAVIRGLLEERSARSRPSLHARMKDLCGALNAPRDLSVRQLNRGYGGD